MWLIPALEHKIVSIDFSPEALVCSWIESSFAPLSLRLQRTRKATEDGPLVLRAYKRFPLNNLELEKLILFNPTIIKEYICSFLEEHNLSDAFIAFILHGPTVVEQFVAMPTSTPHYADFGITNKTHSLLWEYRYLYSNDHGQFVFYVYTIPRPIILQYQLLAIAARCNLITMTTRTTMLLSAYKNIFGVVFRRSQLAVDMMRCNNNIEDIITIDTLNRIVNFAGVCTASERLYCATALGLFCSERIDT
jgi:hypothetical protein